MSRDLYPTLSGASGAWRSLELIANNLANASTTGFKAQRAASTLTGPTGHPLGQAYAEFRPPTVDERDGAVIRDDVPAHLALQGPGYFLVGTGDAALVTRDGRFALDGDRRLVDASGLALQGEHGSIVIPEGETFTVDAEGAVSGSSSGVLDRLRIVLPDGVRPVGGNRLVAEGALRPGAARVVQGALEGSNVDALSAMVELVQASRMFEAFQKAMQASDELDARLNQSGGR